MFSILVPANADIDMVVAGMVACIPFGGIGREGDTEGAVPSNGLFYGNAIARFGQEFLSSYKEFTVYYFGHKAVFTEVKVIITLKGYKITLVFSLNCKLLFLTKKLSWGIKNTEGQYIGRTRFNTYQ